MAESVADVANMVMSLADVDMACKRTVPLRPFQPAFLQVSQKSAQLFKAFLVLSGTPTAKQEL